METLLSPKLIKSVKNHSCNFCGEVIEKGKDYIKSTHVYECHVYDWKTHEHCANIASRLNMYEDFDEGLTQEGFMEIVNEKHIEILINKIPDKDIFKFSDIIMQLSKVRFRDKLWFVIRHFSKLDKSTN